MKKRLLSVAFLMGAMAANAQVGIGTATPNKSAELLIQSSNRGLLIPNVALTSNTDKTTITNGNVESLLVYATATTPKKDITPGYYYWDGAKWARLTADKDIPQIVVNEFANILKMDGDKVANLIIDLVKNNETLTVLAYNPTTGVLTYTDEKKQATTIDVKAAVKSFETVTSITTDATKGTITFKDEAGKDTVLDMKALVKANETLTVLGYDKAKNTLTYSDEKGAVKSIELGTGAMSYNKETNTITYVDAKGVPTTLTLNKTSLTYNETKQQLVYIDSEGKTQTVDLSKLVKANETLTVLGYDKASNTLTYTDEKNAKHTLVLGTGAMSYNKDTNTITYTDAKGVPTTLTLNKTSLTYNETKQQLVYVDSEGKTQTVDLSKLVKTNETVTTLVREKAGKYVYTSENNTVTDITVIGDITEVIKNKVDQDLYNVLKNLVNVEQTLTKLVYNATSRELVYTDEANKTHEINVDALVKDNQTVTTLKQGTNITVTEVKGANSISYTLDVPTATKDVAGVVKPGSGLDVDANGNLTVNLETALNGKDLTGNEKIVVTDGKGAVLKTTKLDINEAKLSLQNIGGTLNLSQLQAGKAGDVLVVDAAGNVVWSAKDAITTNSLVLNGTDLTSTVNGVSSTQTLKDKLTTEMLQNGSVTAEKLGAGKGNEGKVPVAQADGTVVYQNISSANVDGKALTSANNLLTVSAEAGVVLKDVQLTVNQGKFDLAQIGGTLQLTQIQKGELGSVLVTDKDGTVKWVKEDAAIIKDLVKANETITTIVDNGNGTFTYYNEADYGKDGKLNTGATGVTVDTNKTTVEVKEGIYTFKDGKGAIITTINTNAIATGYDNGKSGLTSKDVQGAIDELVNRIKTVENTKGNLTGNGIVVSTSEGVVLKNVELSIADGAITESKIGPGAVTTDKLGEGAVTTEKIKAGKDGEVLVTVVENGKTVTKWVSKTDATTNTLVKKDGTNGNTIVSTVNGVPAEVTLIDKVETKVDGTTIKTVVNGVESASVDLTGAIVAGQKTTSVEKGSDKVSVVGTTTGKNTEYVVDVNEANLSLQNIGGQVTNNQIKGGNDGEVLVTVVENGKTVTKWVTKTAATTNELTSTDNTMTSNVNGVSKTADIINSVENKLNRDNQLITVVNGVEGDAIDLTSAITTGQLKTTVSAKDEKVTVTSALDQDGKTTNYVVGVDETKLNLQNIGGQVTNNQIQGGKEGDVLVTVKEGDKMITKWVTKTDATTNDLKVVGNELVSTVNGKEAKADLTDKISNEMLQSGSVTSDKLNAGNTGVDNRVAVADGAGNVTYKTQKEIVEGNTSNELKLEGNALTSTVNGKTSTVNLTDANIASTKGITGTGISVVGGENSTLKDVTLAITPGTAGQVMVTSPDGKSTTWMSQDEIVKSNTTNVFTSTDNTMTSNVNGVSKTADIINSVENKLNRDNELITVVNGVEGDALDLTPAIQTKQLITTVSAKDKKVTVTSALDQDGKTTNYEVGVVEGELNLGNMGGQVKTTQITDGAVTTEKIKAGKDGEVLVTVVENGVEITKWVSQKDVVKANETITTIKQGTNIIVTKDTNSHEYTIDVPTATKDVAGVVKVGEGLNVDGSGNVTVNYETAKEKLATGNVTSTSITVTGGDKSTFKDVALEITPGKNNGDVLVTEVDRDGKALTKWVSQKDIISSNTTNDIKTEGTNIVTTVNGHEAKLTLAGDVVLKNGETVVGGIQGTPVSDAKPVAGQTLVYNTTTNTWEPGTPNVGVGNVTDAKTLSTDNIILVNGGEKLEKSVLADAKLSIANNAITTDKLKAGDANQVLTTVDKAGTKIVEWKTPVVDITKKGDLTSTTNLLTVDKGNGVVLQNVSLTVNQGNFELNQIGGTLNTTQIKAGNDNQVLTTVGTGDKATVVWKDKEKPVTVTGGKTETGDVVVTPVTDPTTGEKEYQLDVKSAMPKVFYMPPVVFDTSDKKGGAVQERDLHKEYLAQFVNVKANLRSGNAPVSIPNTTNATDLHYYVTYHDESVVEIVSISNDGKLKYKVIGDSTPATFMTIVFVVK